MFPYRNLHQFQKKLYHYENLTHLYYKCSNFLYLIQSNGQLYCFCEKYQGCEFDYNCWRQVYLFYQINNHYKNFEEDLRKVKDKKVKLVKFAFELLELLNECVQIDHLLHESLSGEYSFSVSRLLYSTKNEVSLNNYLKYYDYLEEKKFKRSFRKILKFIFSV